MLVKLNSEKGFTLLELLVVIVVIGILALLVIPNLTSAPKKARDIQRKTDLRAVQKALEEYYVSYSQYPAVTTWSALSPIMTTGTPPLLRTMPADPVTGTSYPYTYTGTATAYTLHACLENQNDAGQFTAADTTNCGTNGRSFVLNNNN